MNARRLRTSVTVFALAASLAACMTVPPEEDPVLIKLTQLENRLAQVERVLENQSLVSLVTQLEQMRGEIAQLRDQVETLGFETDGARKRQRDLYTDLDTRLNALEGRGVVAVNDGGDQNPADLAAAVQIENDRDAYKNAFGLLEAGRYAEAAAAFEQFVQAYPDSALVDNAQYWLAEALYVERDFDRALAEFNRVVEAYPQSRKVPDALLKIGYVHYEQGRYGDARTALERVVTGHSGSTAARLATQRLERMTGEGR